MASPRFYLDIAKHELIIGKRNRELLTKRVTCIAFTAVSLTDDWLRDHRGSIPVKSSSSFIVMFKPELGLTVHWVPGVICPIGKLSGFVWGIGSQPVGHEAVGLFHGQREFS